MKTHALKKKLNADGKRRAAIAQPVPRGVKNPLWFELASRVKEARVAADMALVDVKNVGGIHMTTLGQVERQERKPRLDTIERIAAALGVSACWLAFGEDGTERFQARIARQGKPRIVPRPRGLLPFEELYSGCSVRLRGRREAMDISIRELSRRSGVSYQTVANVEKGRQVPRVDSVHLLAVALDVAPCWLAFGIGRKPGRVRQGEELKTDEQIGRTAGRAKRKVAEVSPKPPNAELDRASVASNDKLRSGSEERS